MCLWMVYLQVDKIISVRRFVSQLIVFFGGLQLSLISVGFLGNIILSNLKFIGIVLIIWLFM